MTVYTKEDIEINGLLLKAGTKGWVEYEDLHNSNGVNQNRDIRVNFSIHNAIKKKGSFFGFNEFGARNLIENVTVIIKRNDLVVNIEVNDYILKKEDLMMIFGDESKIPGHFQIKNGDYEADLNEVVYFFRRKIRYYEKEYCKLVNSGYLDDNSKVEKIRKKGVAIADIFNKKLNALGFFCNLKENLVFPF